MADYMNPRRVCDLVMKGGITSGVVYPPAIDQVAQRFYLCGIGGTSAGAIAAGLAAAAELRRRRGSDEGFKALKGLPQEISAPGRMLELFKPDRSTRPLFNLFLDALKLEGSGLFFKGKLATRAAWQLLVAGALRKMAENGNGMCTGMALANRGTGGALPPLTEWLSERMDSMAGMNEIEKGRPLTFGDLWSAPKPAVVESAMTGATSIRLQLIGTCLSFGRPYALPYLDNRFAFSPDEFRRMFPENVVEYMVKKGREIQAQREKDRGSKPDRNPMPKDLLPLPTGAALPVIVGVRISLCFPVLFALVPLYYPNFHEETGEGQSRYEKVYFADGGITSNLPMHFFDSPFPRWPTLAINLQYTPKGGRPGRSKVDADGIWRAKDNRSGTLEMFTRFLESPSSVGKLMGLAGAIFRSAQVWTDNSFLQMPGYRDRVVELWLNPDEGGMNLEMPQSVIEGLVVKGDAVGRRFVERFADAPATEPMSWDGHRWTRYRSSMAGLASYLRAWRRSVEHPMPDDRPLWDLLASVDAPPSYKFRSDQDGSAQTRRAAAEKATRDLLAYIGSLDASGVCEGDEASPFCNGPRPEVALQARAPLEQRAIVDENAE